MDKINIAVFLDRDGTINKEVDYLDASECLELLPKTPDAIRLLNKNNLKTVVITNQSGIGRGYFTEDTLNEIHEKLISILRDNDAYIDGIYHCPHHPVAGKGSYKKDCDCRKPKPGMLTKAAKEMNIDLSKSYLIGDKLCDIKAAQNAGAKGVLVLTGYGQISSDMLNTKGVNPPAHIAKNIYNAVEWILKDLKQ